MVPDHIKFSRPRIGDTPPARDGVLNSCCGEPSECCGNGETVLFVDDEPALREMGRVMLRRLRFNSLTATDGAAAMVQAAENQKELRAIITDLQMPIMDGLGFVRAVRRILPHIPVVVASGFIKEHLVQELAALGVTHRLNKPFTETQLGNALRSVLC